MGAQQQVDVPEDGDGMKDSEITLIKETPQQDEYGVWHTVETTNPVMCRVGAITRSEYYGAGRKGLNTQKVVTIFEGDYDGEAKCTFEGINYAIYRTYPVGDYLEIYMQLEGGTNG